MHKWLSEIIVYINLTFFLTVIIKALLSNRFWEMGKRGAKSYSSYKCFCFLRATSKSLVLANSFVIIHSYSIIAITQFSHLCLTFSCLNIKHKIPVLQLKNHHSRLKVEYHHVNSLDVFVFINSIYCIHNCQSIVIGYYRLLMVGLPETLGARCVYTLSRMSVHYRTQCTSTFTHLKTK